MSHIIEQIGEKTFLEYFNKIGLSQRTGIDLQGESKPLNKKNAEEFKKRTADKENPAKGCAQNIASFGVHHCRMAIFLGFGFDAVF
jgi:cell division protein FtsI/penicillin-binding protein 2